MKKIFTFLALALLVQMVSAQNEQTTEKEEMNTIFTKENLKITGGYISPEIKVGDVHQDPSLFVGGKIGMTFNKNFTLGVAAYGLTSNSNFDLGTTPETLARIGMAYGGLALEYTIFSNKVVHFNIPVVTGVAGVFVTEDNDDYFYDKYYDDIENSAAFVFEPGVNLEINLFKFCRFNIGASYRLIEGTDLTYLSDEDLSDLSFNASFKFGFF